ncbi:MAG TPA: hypothetical protein VF634_08735 [Pyrinomonadaceae bacterium]|jgi:hypothetical protein
MDEAKQTKHGVGSGDASAQSAARQDEATNSDTLSDLQKTQTDSAQSDTSGASDSASAPAPDGTPDPAGGGTADGRDSGGPM